MRKFLKSIVKIAQILITVLLAVLLVCNLYLAVMSRAFGVENPALFGYSTAVVVSGSMEPALSVDDLIVNHAQDAYEAGDIITFKSGSSLTTHRIAAVTPEGYITRGDANNAADSDPVSQEAVIGRVIWKIPYVGSVLAFFKTPFGMTTLVFIGFLILELPFFFKKRREEVRGGNAK